MDNTCLWQRQHSLTPVYIPQWRTEEAQSSPRQWLHYLHLSSRTLCHQLYSHLQAKYGEEVRNNSRPKCSFKHSTRGLSPEMMKRTRTVGVVYSILLCMPVSRSPKELCHYSLARNLRQNTLFSLFFWYHSHKIHIVINSPNETENATQ